MKLHTKAKTAKEITLASLFIAGGTVDFAQLQQKRIRWDRGKYKPAMAARDNHSFPIPVWYERRSDHSAIFAEDRRMIILWCVDEQKLSESETTAYQRALKIWAALSDTTAAASS